MDYKLIMDYAGSDLKVEKIGYPSMNNPDLLSIRGWTRLPRDERLPTTLSTGNYNRCLIPAFNGNYRDF